jgi:hypothetical protein
LEKDPATGRFLPGNSGFGGRPRGSRNKLTTEFLDALYADFQANGAEAVARCRKEKPAEYVRIVASILPKDLELTVNSQVEVTGILEAADNRASGRQRHRGGCLPVRHLGRRIRRPTMGLASSGRSPCHFGNAAHNGAFRAILSR